MMNDSACRIRLDLLAAAITMVLVALAVVTLVVPPALADSFSLANPESAARLFAVWAVLESLIGIALFLLLLPRRRHEYRFIAEFAWIHHVNNPDKVQLTPASHGYNSVIVVESRGTLLPVAKEHCP